MQTLTPPPAAETTAPGDVVARLRESFDAGRTRPVDWRRVQLERLRAMVVRHERELLDALASDLGKPAIEAWASDLSVTLNEIDHALGHLDAWMQPAKVRVPLNQRPGRARIVAEPLGVALVIAPWNYPVQLLLTPAIGALAAGNCVVLKPSEIAAATSALLAKLVPRYLDPECVAVVEGGVDETTALLDEHFDHIFYTGNGRVGRVVMEAAAKHLTPVTLELGGKSPAIVDESARIGVAARRIAWGKFLNAGQTCIAPDYVLASRRVADELVDGIVASVRDFYGSDPQASPDYARIVSDRHYDRLARLVEGGTAILGGSGDPTTRYFAPTVLTEVDLDADVMAEEIFGPILPIVPVDGVDEAIAFVNGRDKPLALYVFTESEAVQHAVIERTSAGGMCVNHTIFQITIADLPFGGVGPSGIGRYHGKASFDTFSHDKAVLTKSTRLDPKLGYPPYTERKQRFLRRFL